MDLNYTIDFDRDRRLGFPEVVFGENKRAETILEIIATVLPSADRVLITRLQANKLPAIRECYPNTFYDEASQVCLVGAFSADYAIRQGAAILSGGTSDEYVVNEAYYTLRFLGVEAQRFQDIGAAGIHRLLRHEETIRSFKVLIVVAGFEAALATVAGGLFPQPIIGVPASVGYGVAAGGQAALHSMLASCANGIMVANIDNGYGAALAAYRMLKTLCPDPE